MNLEDLIKLAGVTKSPYDTPVQEQPTEIEEQPVMDDNEGMRALIALVTPEQLNQLQGNAPVEEEGFANSGDEYAGEPEEYKGTLGSPADLSLRRYLGANGEHVTVDETKVYEDHKVEDINEAWQAYKLNERPSDFAKMLGTRPPDAIGPRSKPKTPSPAPRVGEPVPGIRQPSEPDPIIGPSAGDPVMPGISSANLDGDMPDEPSKPMPAIDPKDLDGDMPATRSQPSMGKDVFGRDKAKLAQKDRDFMKYMQRVMNSATNTDKPLEEEPNEANAFIKAKIDAEKAGEDEFTVDGKKFKVKDSADLDRLKKLAGAQQVDEAPFPGEYDYSDDKYDADGAVTGVNDRDVDLRFAKWSKDTPSQLMAVINKLNLTPDEAWQMGNRDNFADVDIVVDYHDKFTDRFDTSGMSDDEITDAIDIDGGTAWMDSPEHDALYDEVINPLCKAMGMEGGNVEECGQALMKYIDDTPPQESVIRLKNLAGV